MKKRHFLALTTIIAGLFSIVPRCYGGLVIVQFTAEVLARLRFAQPQPKEMKGVVFWCTVCMTKRPTVPKEQRHEYTYTAGEKGVRSFFCVVVYGVFLGALCLTPDLIV